MMTKPCGQTHSLQPWSQMTLMLPWACRDYSKATVPQMSSAAYPMQFSTAV